MEKWKNQKMLESELLGDTIGKLNIINVVTTDNILIPWYVFTLAHLTLVTADCGWDTVVLVHARLLVFLLVLLYFVMLEPQERILVHCWYTGDAAGKTDVEKSVSGMRLWSRVVADFGAEHCLPFSCE